MIKMTSERDGRHIVVLGLSHGNLGLLPESPIEFPGEQVGLDEKVWITLGPSTPLVARITGPNDVHIALTGEMEAALRAGELVTVDFDALDVARPGEVHLFAGPTEAEMLEALKQGGLVGGDTAINDLSLGQIQSRHRVSIGAAAGPLFSAIVLTLFGLAAFVLGLMGELKWPAIPIGPLMALGGLFMFRVSRGHLSMLLELGDVGFRVRHKGQTLTLPWAAIARVQMVPITVGKMFWGEERIVGALHVHGVYGEHIALTRELGRWKDVIATFEEKLGITLQP